MLPVIIEQHDCACLAADASSNSGCPMLVRTQQPLLVIIASLHLFC